MGRIGVEDEEGGKQQGKTTDINDSVDKSTKK